MDCGSGEEEEESFELEDEWIETLMKQYRIARKKYEKMVSTVGAKELQRSLQQKRIYRTFDGVPPVPFKLDEHLVKSQGLAFFRSENNAILQKCSIIPIEKIESTPTMQYWTLTEVNIIAEDEYTLSHIPFLGDAEDDTKFCEELQRTFPDGIHGTKRGCGEYINDWILFHVIKGMRVALPQLDDETFFHAIYKQFPNKASAQDLSEMYPDLQIRFEPESIVRQDLTNENGELIANFSATRLLNSYEVLICHKCFSYDCTMHNATTNEHYNTKRRYVKSSQSGREGNKEPRFCSPTCYLSAKKLSVDSAAAASTSASPRSTHSLKVDVAAADNDSCFTPHEESLFNILRSTGPMENFCKMTNIFNMCTQRKRTCRELYEYACRKTPLSPRLNLTQTSPVKARKKKVDSHRTFRAVKWACANGKVENNSRYRPCSHKGDCRKDTNCRCVGVGNLCTKYCPCSDDCQNRFPGCRCAPGNCRTRQCQCYFASWECDPDICKSCNCDKFDGCGEPICKNVSIQRGLQKRLLVAPSQVAGWGCFCQEDIEKNEFISEYCGEVISQSESERRGKIYDKIKCSYLFGLNDEQVVDATRVGNVIRFANHSCNPNCRAKVIVVNGDHKIGIFANRKINRGEELFFDYAYNKSQQVAFLSKELPKNFYAASG